MAVKWLMEHSTSHQLCGVLTVLCSEIRHCAKRQNVSKGYDDTTENVKTDKNQVLSFWCLRILVVA